MADDTTVPGGTARLGEETVLDRPGAPAPSDDTKYPLMLEETVLDPGRPRHSKEDISQKDLRPGDVWIKDPPYEEMLAFKRGTLLDALKRRRLEAAFQEIPQVRAHLESVRFLDLERAAAMQDEADLERFDVGQATELCRKAALSDGLVFAVADPPAETKREWARHTRACVFCRRMRRRELARAEARRAGLPDGTKLLLNWLLDQHCEDLLNALAKEIRTRIYLAPLEGDVRRVAELGIRKVPREQAAAELDMSPETYDALWAEALKQMSKIRDREKGAAKP